MTPQAELFLDDLRNDGRVDSTGSFTLDAAKAREKMKKYQLQDPHRYVLQVVQSAVAGGASFVDVRCDADDCWLRYDGRPLTAEELGSLFTSLFHADRGGSGLSLRELAIGLNAALGLSPEWILVESWDGKAGASLRLAELREDVADLEACPWAEGDPGTAIHVRQRLSWRVLARFVAGLVAVPPEGQALRDRCARAPIPVRFNGRDVRKDFSADDALARSREEGRDLSADLALPRGLLSRSEIEVVLNGVTIARKAVKLGTAEVKAVVRARRLAKNVSQSDIVEDGAWREVLSSLRAGVRNLVLQVSRDFAENPRLELVPHLLRAIQQQGIRARKGWERWQELKQALIDLPLFSGHDGAPLTLRPLLEQHDRLGHLPACRVPTAEALPDRPLVALLTPSTEPVLRSVFKFVQEVDADLAAAKRRRERYEQWLSQPPQEPRLVLGPWLARVPLEPPLRGEVALPDGPPAPDPPLVLFKEGRPLLTTAMRPRGPDPRAVLWPGVAAAVEHDGLEPDAAWQKPLENRALEEVRKAVEEALPRLFAALAAADLAGGKRRQHAALASASYLHFLALGGHIWAGPGNPLPEGVSEVPTFLTLDGRRGTLREVAAELEKHGELAWVEDGMRLPPDMDPGRLVLQPSPWELRALEAFFSSLYLANIGSLLAREARKAAFLQRPVQEPAVPDPVVVRVEFGSRDGLKGQVAVRSGAGSLGRHPGLDVLVLHEGRLLGRRLLEDSPGRLDAVMEIPGVQPNEDFTDLVEDEAWLRAAAVLRGAIRRIPERLAALLPGLPAGEREAALELLWSHLSHEAGPSCDGFFEKLDPLRKEMMRLPAFPTVDGGWCSIRDILDAAHRDGRVGYLAAPPKAGLRKGELVLLAPQNRVHLLRGIVGTYRVEDASDRFRQRAREEALAGVPPVDRLEVTGGPYLAVATLEGRVEGQVGLLADPTAESLLVLHRQRRPLARVPHRLAVPVEAVVNCDDLRPGPEGVVLDEAFSGLVEILEKKAAGMAAEAAREAPPERWEDRAFRRWVMGLAARMQGEGRRRGPEALVRALLGVPLFPTTDGGRAGLGVLSEAFAVRGCLSYVPQGHGLPEELVRQASGDRPVPLLSAEDRERLSRMVYPLEDLSPALRIRQRALANRARERVVDRSLESRFPGTRWLARVQVDEEGMTGELGLPDRRLAEPGVVLCVDSIPLARVDLFPGPGFLGIIDGPFRPTETWDGLAEVREPRRLLEAAHRRLMGALLGAFPAEGDPGFPRARQAVLTWTDWRSTLEVPLGGLERALAELPLFRLAEGRHGGIAAAGEQARRFRRILRCLPGQSPPASEEAVFEIDPGSEEERFLAALSPRGLMEWEVALVVDVPSSPAPEEPTRVPGPPVEANETPPPREEATPGASPPPEPAEDPRPGAERPPEPPPPSPEETLLAALRGEIRLLREAGHPELSEEILAEIRLAPSARGPLWNCSKGGRKPVLNSAHPAAKRLLAASEIRPEGLYFLLSSLYSVLNRACPEIEDRHEREFHRRLLATLLGTS